MEFLWDLARDWAVHFQRDLFRYLLATTCVSLAVSWLFRRWMDRRRIQRRRAGWRDIRREFSYSMLTLCVFATMGVITGILYDWGVVQLYRDRSLYPLWWNLASLPLVILLHDAYFYWAHRAMHHPKLFRHFHRLHHLSRTPTPWAAYSFSVGEAFLMAIFSPLAMILLPLHLLVWLSFLFIMIFRNAMLHASCEFHPRGWVDGPLDLLTTTTHHDLHHQRFHGNYGFYFTWWDRWMGTELRNYKQAFRQAAGREIEDSGEAAPV
ncbi:sterol desaturase family protein [Microbulbifer rhizosphaerae]|uniref:Sterol desaturase/sphingolipid hydroxylase (Fatty acid hydroxylase superfamily) n=1 Tax=Microbulbifer rhizosphaerae TaxID=1562603 RepID=A0A7W4WEH9_9GAMM|nr:sterol desaturase family protein [Microbulbifer rhizosphaerae]MBB3062779.1 sterol desaturase/sphingolipid hydroxylase (fatty acid hydroxylase superfamily) [Microbulbifer rhizosphaerae]